MRPRLMIPIHEPDLDEQHALYRWMTTAALLADPQAHENTKAYFPVSADGE